ncbi:MAG: response regulator transcription factor [Anaerolineales bacterium]|jgi:DNA-binding NarL/FixJ family response regulator
MAIRVLVADDHKLFRQGLISLIRTRGDDVEVIGEAATGKEAIQLAKQLRPDVVLMDIYMPHGDGLQTIKEMRERFPDIAVVMLTSSEDDRHLYEAVRLGASGYLLKSLDASELFDLLKGIMHGEAAMTREMAARLLKSVSNRSVRADRGEEPLTDREIDVLGLVAQGASNLQIADILCISINTVKSHLKNILAKLQLENRTQAAAYAVKSGLVSTLDEDRNLE